VKNYSQHANPAFEERLALRTAAKEGAFFMPFLRPGMRVLDVGCGPGSITLGLAEKAAPGEVAARVRVVPRIGPTHGVQPEANAAPKTNEVR